MFVSVYCFQGILDGLPVELKESGLAEQAGLIMLRERHKGAVWKAADAIIDPLYKLLDPEACGHIPVEKFKQYFLHRLHPELERYQNSPVAARRGSAFVRLFTSTTGHSTSGASHDRTTRTEKTWDFNRVVQGARQTYQARQAARSRRGSGGCFTSGTAVLTPTGLRVSIDRLQLGDAVMAFDCEGILQPATVRGCMSFLSDKHLVLTLSNSSVMHVTDQHPICVSSNTFCRADALSVGHRVMVADCESLALVDAVLTHVEHVTDRTIVYNLSTTPHHTFFAADVAVHNKGGGGGCFSGDVLVTVLSKDGGKKHVGMRMLKPGDVIQGMSLLCVNICDLSCV